MEELKRVRATNVNLVASKEHYVDKIASLQDQVESLRTTLDSKSALVAQLQCRLDELESSTYGIVNDARVALEEACHQRDKNIRSLQRVLKEKEQSISALEKGREDISHRYNSLVAEQASASIEAQTSSFRLNAEDGELERLTKEIARLKSADAAKEVSRPRVSSPRFCVRTDTLLRPLARFASFTSPDLGTKCARRWRVLRSLWTPSSRSWNS